MHEGKKERIINKLLTEALQLSEVCLYGLKNNNYDQMSPLLEQRGEVIDIFLKLNSGTKSKTLEEKIDKLIKMNNEILPLLISEKQNTQNEIAKTLKNKENLKGYNLKNIK